MWLTSLSYINKLRVCIETCKLAPVDGRYFTKLAHSRGSKWWWWEASVSQPSSLGRREKEESERRYIQSLISHCFSGPLSSPSLHARQRSDKVKIKPTLSGLSFTLLQLCHVTPELSSPPDIISLHLFLFSFTITEDCYCGGAKLLLP